MHLLQDTMQFVHGILVLTQLSDWCQIFQRRSRLRGLRFRGTLLVLVCRQELHLRLLPPLSKDTLSELEETLIEYTEAFRRGNSRKLAPRFGQV